MNPGTYVANAIAMWADLAPTSERTPTYFRADLPSSTRVILTEPGTAATEGQPGTAATERQPGTTTAEGAPVPSVNAGTKITIEDSWCTAPPSNGFDVLRMPLMVRPPGLVTAVDRPGVRVVRVGDVDGLAEAERIMVEGFPLRSFQPLTRGSALPPRLLDTPGWDIWLGYRDGRPAAAGYTFHDGDAVGVYWLATRAEHRSAGLGRAVLATALATRPDRPWTLVATDAGRPLYESLGFETVTTAMWYTRN